MTIEKGAIPPSRELKNGHVWRNDITGLRALAVIPVLIYHAFPSLIPNGFLGVDVFFVISGYLISGIIFRGLQKGAFSWKSFYAKRVKRIFPPLLLVLLFVAVVGWFFMTREEYVLLGKEIYGSAFFFENLRLLSQVGYFDPSVIYKPLIHIWSLSVEEQFYIVFPLIAMALWRFFPQAKWLGLFVLAMTVSSLSWCLLAQDKSFAFYFPLTRFWELSFGILLAWGETFYAFQLKGKSARLVPAIGFVLIVTTYFLVINELESPGFLNLGCVLGAVMVLMGRDGFINKTVLSAGPMVFVGLVSYSLYLWHWPLLSFQALIYPMGAWWVTVGMLLASLLLATASYYWVENPVRRLKGKASSRAVVVLLALLVLAFAMGQGIRSKKGFPDRAFVKNNPVLSLRENKAPEPKGWHQQTIDGVELEVTDPSRPPEILFVGDSHANQYRLRLLAQAKRTGKVIGLYAQSGCLMVPGVEIDEVCGKKSMMVEKLYALPSVKRIVLMQIWGEWKNTLRYRYKFKDAQGVELTLRSGGFENAIEVMKSMVKRHSDKRYYVVLDAPWDHGSYDIGKRINRFETMTGDSFVVPYPELAWWKDGDDYIAQAFKGLAEVLDPTPTVCPNQLCDLVHYSDDDHMDKRFLEKNATWLDPIFND